MKLQCLFTLLTLIASNSYAMDAKPSALVLKLPSVMRYMKTAETVCIPQSSNQNWIDLFKK